MKFSDLFGKDTAKKIVRKTTKTEEPYERKEKKRTKMQRILDKANAREAASKAEDEQYYTDHNKRIRESKNEK